MIFWILIAVFVIGTVLFWLSKDDKVIVGFVLMFMSFFSLFVIVLTASQDVRFTLDEGTKSVSTPPAAEMLGIPSDKRTCGPNDDKAILVTGKTSDVTFWVPWGAPQDYKRVEVCG